MGFFRHPYQLCAPSLLRVTVTNIFQSCLDVISPAHSITYCFVFPDPVSLVRDHNVKEKLVELGISVQSYNGDLLFEPWEVYDENGHAFTTFEAYWEKCLQMPMEPVSLLPPWKLRPATGTASKYLYRSRFFSLIH